MVTQKNNSKNTNDTNKKVIMNNYNKITILKHRKI